ncbi:DUF1145 domain-containing protein [Paraferrimonas haliotis]|uniref:DUF1145 domain-containing protein n=1 Tax=Paraferrimonas haliotis TaxID=2013866 RepID=A0AA37TJ39_9GAMM|nr:DUF1145 domain-containing protein [Paraferrimonas haliotis]GLS82079.1 hypothetical protein GCM10007894_00560 [Paraferrimonas haliotis]
MNVLLTIAKFGMMVAWLVMITNAVVPFQSPWQEIIEAALVITLLGHTLLLIGARLRFKDGLSNQDKLSLMAFGVFGWLSISMKKR